MTDPEKERDYYLNLSDNLGGQLLRTRDEHTRAMGSLRRARTTTSLIKKIYRLDHMNLSTSGLAKVFLETALDSLNIERAGLFRYEPGEGTFRPLHVVGFQVGNLGMLKGVQAPTGFFYANAQTEHCEFCEAIEEATGARYFLWSFDEASNTALFFGNCIEDKQIHRRFDEADGEVMDSALDVFINIMERKRAEQQLLHDAFHDSLTGLPNRALFIEHLDQAMRRSKRATGYLFSVLFLDLDRFKLVNDSLGHAAGDQLLQTFAQRLARSVRTGDIVARLGGDEFAVLADDLKDMEDALHLADRIHTDLQEPFNINNQAVFTSTSIGIAKSAERYENGEELLRDADIAMYSAKELGGGSHRMFDSDMHVVMVSRLQLETDLRHAIERDQLRLHFQPIIDLHKDELVGFEALLRWKHPRRGIIPPIEFVPMAEETGLIVPIGNWMLDNAANYLQQWNSDRKGNRALSVSVNISDREFLQPELVSNISKALNRVGLPANCLELELTERMLMHYAKLQSNALTELRDQNIRIAIDDFGTGYSSLSRLQQLPIDKLKIDQSFIKDMERSEENAEIVRTIIAMAGHLGMEVVAEGVETSAQYEQLKELGCHYAQGYYFAKPASAENVPGLISRRSWTGR
ncbi:MAG: EAL domain-containing protein [Gammaproteobacteria bacterium]|nr:EAL domain-containing protein [Gammaproteobacteria bacterium]